MFKKIVLVVVALAISASAFAAHKQSTKHISGVVNINSATVSELTLLPGVGKSKAEAIVAQRQKAQFKSPQEITKVKGIGKKKFEKIQQYIAVDGPTTAKVVKSQGNS